MTLSLSPQNLFLLLLSLPLAITAQLLSSPLSSPSHPHPQLASPSCPLPPNDHPIPTTPPTLFTIHNQDLVQDGNGNELSGLMGSENGEGEGEELGLEKRQDPPASMTTVIPPTVPAGGLTFGTPAATAGASYIKIAQGQSVTFGWNYTSVLVTPASLTFQAFCSDNSVTYPVGPTSGIPGAQSTLVWSPGDYQASPGVRKFIDASYTLHVFDERGPSAGASPGLMAPFSGLQFAMYVPEPYTPLADWTCAACSGSDGGLIGLVDGVKGKLVGAIVLSTVVGIVMGGGWVFGR